MIDSLKTHKLNLAPPATSSSISCATGTKTKDENVALANSKARLPSDALDTSLGTDNCGSPQLRNAAEPKSHIYNSKQGAFSEAIGTEKYHFIESDVLLHHSGNQINTFSTFNMLISKLLCT